MTASLNQILREIEKLKEDAAATAVDLRQGIVSGRNTPRPWRTEAALRHFASLPGIDGDMARGDLRLRRIGDSVEAIDAARELPQMMGEMHADPLEFVMWAFDWGSDPSMRVVELPASYRDRFDSAHGPDAWACELLDDIGRQVRKRAFDGAKAVDAVRVAVASGHGIGKSAVTAWLTLWIMSTRPNARGVVTASTAPQLESKTWAQIATWAKRCATREWWDVSTGRGSMKLVSKLAPSSWSCYAQTARAENAESFAGLHAADSSPFFIVDESSGVPDAIHEVMQGAMTDGEPFLLAFGNPTRNSGWFHAAFNAQRHRWTTRQIDSRDVAITNKTQLKEWVDDFGVESDFVKVRVRGIFPSASSLQFIDRQRVDEAMVREVPFDRQETAVVGVDPARYGDDSSVIYTRVGRDGRSFPPIRLRGVDTMQLASRVAEQVNYLRGLGLRVSTNVDGAGVGGGVVDRLRQMGFAVVEVQFGGRADDPKRYANKRAEIWARTKDWLAGAAIVQDEALAVDLTSVEYAYNTANAIQLERKESMKARGLASPDTADALACTFAVPVPIAMGDDYDDATAERDRQAVLEHDPLAPMR